MSRLLGGRGRGARAPWLCRGRASAPDPGIGFWRRSKDWMGIEIE